MAKIKDNTQQSSSSSAAKVVMFGVGVIDMEFGGFLVRNRVDELSTSVGLSKKINIRAPMPEKIFDLTQRMEKVGRTISLSELLANL